MRSAEWRVANDDPLGGSTSIPHIAVRNHHSAFPTGAPGATRTPDPLLRRQLLYPLSYRRLGHLDFGLRISEWETGKTSLFIPHSAFEIPHSSVARPERIELPTCWFEASRSIQLSYGRPSADFRWPIFNCRFFRGDPLLVFQSPIPNRKSAIRHGVNGGTRTLNPWSHSPVL